MSATRMNVFYRGLDNPFDISGGIPKENLEVEMTNGKVTKTGDSFIVRPTELDEQGKRTTVTVYANMNNGRNREGVDVVNAVSVDAGGVEKLQNIPDQGLSGRIRRFQL